MSEKGKNLAASVRQRLANVAERAGADFQRILSSYAIERFLYRLSASKHGKGFVLKGATLFTLGRLPVLANARCGSPRLKDFFDLWHIARNTPFNGEKLSSAITGTFERRKTAIPSEPPVGLSAEFSENPMKQTKWRAFCRKAVKALGSNSVFKAK